MGVVSNFAWGRDIGHHICNKASVASKYLLSGDLDDFQSRRKNNSAAHAIVS